MTPLAMFPPTLDAARARIAVVRHRLPMSRAAMSG